MAHDSSNISTGSKTNVVVSAVGENVRRLREQRGWSLGELARAAQVSKSTVSTIEGRGGNPGLETLVALSVALGVPFNHLISPPRSQVDRLTADEAPTIESAGGTFRGRLMLASGRSTENEVYLFELDPGEAHHAEPHTPGATETVICLDGRVWVGPVGDEVELDPGDRATFAADQPHSYRTSGRTARMALVLTYRSG
jgi:transcriptional regulator with XRE-family HTH domain